MKRLLGLLVTSSILLLGSTGCLGPSKMTTPELTNHTGNSSVALIYDDPTAEVDETEYKPFCSGTWIDDTHVLTAYHCAKGLQKHLQAVQDEKEKNRQPCEGFRALFGMCDPDAKPEHKVVELENLPVHYIQRKEVDQMGSEPTAWHLSKLVSWDSDKDLALLEAQGHAIPGHEVAVLADKVPEVGEFVMVVGHPKGYYWTFLTGTVAGYREVYGDKDRGPMLQLQVPAFYGNSGGGAFNQYGQLIGVTDLLPQLPAESMYVPVETIKHFLQGARSQQVLLQLKLGK